MDTAALQVAVCYLPIGDMMTNPLPPPPPPQPSHNPPPPPGPPGPPKGLWADRGNRIVLIGLASILGLFVLIVIVAAASTPNPKVTAGATVPTYLAPPEPTTAARPTTTAAPTTTAEPTTTAAPTTTVPPPPPPPAPTVSQKNAVRKAESYLRTSAFSRQGLIEQLLYNEYSEADATYAVDTVTVDWNEQAAKKAASYMRTSAFSRQGLIDQLLYNDFTPEQAEYGVSTTGL